MRLGSRLATRRPHMHHAVQRVQEDPKKACAQPGAFHPARNARDRLRSPFARIRIVAGRRQDPCPVDWPAGTAPFLGATLQYSDTYAVREIIRLLDCSNGRPSCLPFCRPQSTRETGCIAISFTHLTRPGTHGAQSRPACRKGAATSSHQIFPTRMLWMDCPGDGEALGITYSPTHVVPLRELRSHMS